MDTRKIGSLDVTVVGLGTNNFGLFMQADEVGPVVRAALDAGVNFFDTADSYGNSEELLARSLGRHRDEVVIATKFGSSLGPERPGGAAAAYVRRAVDRSLRQLDTDRIDLYQLHRPDPSTPIGETLSVLDELVRAGKVREIGCSNFSADQLLEAHDAVGRQGAHFVSLQNEYSLLNRGDEAEVLPECQRQQMAYLPYFPLASGILTGKYTRGEPPPPGTRIDKMKERMGSLLSDDNFDVVDRLSSWAEVRGHSISELAIAWLAANPAVASVIAGATKSTQVKENTAAAEWRLNADELAEVDALATVGEAAE